MTSPATPVDPTKLIELTNESGTPVIVLVPTTSSDAPDPTEATPVYEQALEILISTNGSTTVANSATAQFILDQYYIDSTTHDKKYSTIYNLLVSTSNWYVPVANLGVVQDIFATPPSYPAQTAAADEAAAIANAGVFYQTISAYPTSALATNFQNAMGGTLNNASGPADGSPNSSANVASSISDSVKAFFQSTKSFKNVTLAGLVAMENYYLSFPFIWADPGHTGNATYYLYSSSGKATSFVGTISLTKPAQLDVTLANGGYTCTFSPASNPSDTTSVDVNSSQAKALTYSNGVFIDDPDSDTPSIAVKGTFQVKRFFTQQPADTQIIAVLTGTINGSICLGFDSPQKSDDKTNSEFWDALFHPKTSAQIFQSVMQIGGAIMLLFFFGQVLYGIYKWASNLSKAKEPTTDELLKAQQESLEKILSEKIDAIAKQISNGQQQAPDSPEAASEAIAEQRDVVADNQNQANLEDSLKLQQDNAQELAKFESEMSSDQLVRLEEVGSQIQDSNTALENATPETLPTVVEEQTTALTKLSDDVSSLTADVSNILSKESSTMIEQNTELSDAIHQDIEDSDSNAAEDKANDDPDAADPFVPEV
ncbi:hypothetical protein BGZ96_004592 [Linnemannia gamsii]|uniref:Uncharacterized protein n=1 Tax=Linnemannia gamsii TaxID=64522 RepID=A0ABQ7K5G3_9FUNG|nr:hypothetical protein BGZ96_004592 [Linnemannia gamsii]